MTREQRWSGQSVTRREDPALIRGEARYTDDLSEPGMVYAAILRSPHAHARIESIQTEDAREMDGVTAVFTGRDVEDSGIPNHLLVGEVVEGTREPGHPLLALGTVRFQGEGVAVVLAEDRYTARDALDQINVSYETLPAAADLERALDSEAPRVHEEYDDNRALRWEHGDGDAVEDAFNRADHTVQVRTVHQRLIPNAMEPRAALATYESRRQKLTLKMTTQAPHHHRILISRTLGIPENRLRVIAPEVGGGFGSKDNHYAEEALVGWCAMQTGRPVKWAASRSESFLTDVQGRGRITEAEMALDENGRILGLRVHGRADMGAYLGSSAPIIVTEVFSSVLSGQYRIPAIHCRVTGVFTNRVPVDAYRGAGRPEATFALERLVNRAAHKLEMDAAELRRRNFIPPDEFPYESALGPVYDSGHYERALDKALEMGDYESLRRRRRDLRERGRYLGIGLGCFVESAGAGPSGTQASDFMPAFSESSIVRFHPSGKVTAYSGASAHGQGHQTTFAQILSDRLGVPYEDIEVIEGDTESIPEGTGTFASRSISVGGSSLLKSADRVIQKARAIASHQLEADPEDVQFQDGAFSLRGAPERSITIQDVAREAYQGVNLPPDMELGLEATSFYDPENFTFPFGVHLAVVEVDPDTGSIDLRRYVAVDDCGTQINPLLVEGQIHGGVAQGIGEALYEQAHYDREGNLTSGSMMDYVVPKAEHIPELETASTETPCPHNPLGAKGCGESGTIGAAPAIVNATVDALQPFGVQHIDLPLTPEKVWRAIHGEAT